MENTLTTKIEQYIGKAQQRIEQGKTKCSEIHTQANHSDHSACVVVGLNATVQQMCTLGSQGSYFTLDEDGIIHEQHFVQGLDGHEYGICTTIKRNEFMRRVYALPNENMANAEKVIERLERIVKKD